MYCDEQIGEVTASQLFHFKVAVLRKENLQMVRNYLYSILLLLLLLSIKDNAAIPFSP